MLNLPSIDKHDAEPVSAQNPAYQKSLVYRADDYSSLRFKLLQHLEEAFPNWNRMLADKTGPQDFGVAFIEMFSYMADVTFLGLRPKRSMVLGGEAAQNHRTIISGAAKPPPSPTVAQTTHNQKRGSWPALPSSSRARKRDAVEY